MSKRTIFPITGWVEDLSELPRVREDDVNAFCRSRLSTERSVRRSYNFHVECYVVAASLRANYTKKIKGTFFLRSRCYRSKKKTSRPYVITAAIAPSGTIQDGDCECPAGAGCCNHLIAVLRTLDTLQRKEYAEAPEHLSCTDFPQQWRAPRGATINGTSIQHINWRAVREGSCGSPVRSRLYDCRAVPRTQGAQQDAMERFAESLFCLDGNGSFGDALMQSLPCRPAFRKTKFGEASELSPLSYQQPLLPFGFEVLLSGIEEAPSREMVAAQEPQFFRSSSTWVPPAGYEQDPILKDLHLTADEAVELEKNTRRQHNSTRWRTERQHRVTASNFGLVTRRMEWTRDGLHALLCPQDLSRLPAIRYGQANEALAAQRYQEVLQSLGHSVTLFGCGLLVDPATPWLGASPDRIVFDPCERQPHGVVEIKCPYSLRNAYATDIPALDYISRDEHGRFHLSLDHKYHYQVLGQMGLSGLSWGDFVVYSDNFIFLERVRFDPAEWEATKLHLESFYFDIMLGELRRMQ